MITIAMQESYVTGKCRSYTELIIRETVVRRCSIHIIFIIEQRGLLSQC